MYKGFKFRMYPTDKQKEIINMNFRTKRFIYNHYLEGAKASGKLNTKLNIKDYNQNLKKDNQFLQNSDENIIYKTLFSLEDSYKRTKNLETMKYKSKFRKNSYTIPVATTNYTSNVTLDLERKMVTLPLLENIKIKGYKKLSKLNGKIKSLTISKEPNGKYYISFLCEILNNSLIKYPKTIVGIDLGIKELLTLSDGTTYNNIHTQEKYEKRIKRKQRELRRKTKGSKNYYKCKKELAILYCKLANSRKYYTHKITKNITDNYDIIATETLSIKRMIMNKQNNLSKSISDAAFQEITRQLEYKSKEKGKYFYKINAYYPSSQICSVCNNQDNKYKDLGERTYNCKCCKNELDRDFNASVNIMFEGLKLYIKSYA